MTPDEWLMTNVSIDSSSPASSSGMRSAIDLFFGLRLSRTPTSPNWNEPSTRTVSLAELGRGRDREVDRDRRSTDAALGAEDRDQLAGFAVGATGGAVAAAATAVSVTAIRRFSRSRVVDLADRGGQLVAS